jgi:hypothetical protein
MSSEDETRKATEEDSHEDLELAEGDAESVAGGRKAGKSRSSTSRSRPSTTSSVLRLDEGLPTRGKNDGARLVGRGYGFATQPSVMH